MLGTLLWYQCQVLLNRRLHLLLFSEKLVQNGLKNLEQFNSPYTDQVLTGHSAPLLSQTYEKTEGIKFFILLYS